MKSPPIDPQWLLRMGPNAKGRDLVVGDIHGCLDELLNLLEHVEFDSKRDRLFSVGDLVDRGHNSIGVLRLLKKPWFFAVRGNHEQMLIDHLRFPNDNPPFDPKWLDAKTRVELEEALPDLEALPYVITTGEAPDSFHVVHAELWLELSELREEDIAVFPAMDPDRAYAKALWSRHMIGSHWRNEGIAYHGKNLSRVFCGHTIVQLPILVERAVYLDTGAFAPYLDPSSSQVEHFGLTLADSKTLEHWFAPTCAQYRGAVVDLGVINARLGS